MLRGVDGQQQQLPHENEEEAYERLEAELQFIECAYSKDECWIDRFEDGGSNAANMSSGSKIIVQVKRRLLLSVPAVSTHYYCEHPTSTTRAQLCNNGKGVASSSSIILTLSIPEGYPVKEEQVVQLEASLTGHSMTSSWQKSAVKALPSLLAACRREAKNCSGCEALHPILSCAESWVENDWRAIVSASDTTSPNSSNVIRNSAPLSSLPVTVMEQPTKSYRSYKLVQRLIYSHHIIAKSKRKSLKDLATKYNLGGYVKIGWPGIIIVEGLEADCDGFTGEIKGMKWQYLNVRGEQQADFDSLETLEGARVFTRPLTELDQHEMSTLATLCQDRGLASLFKSCMKIYESENNPSVPTGIAKIHCAESTTTTLYGALIVVHHMNNVGHYSKWLKKTTKSFGCHLLIKCLKHSSTHVTEKQSTRNVTVILLGSEEGVKQVIKLWRVSRVDLDAYHRPCLERMMSILIQGPIAEFLKGESDVVTYVSQHSHDDFFVPFDNLERILLNIGGASWGSIWSEAMSKKW